MNESRLRTIEQLEEFLKATARVEFPAHKPGAVGEDQRYEHMSRVLTRFDYAHRNKRERGVVLDYLRHTSGYARAQMPRLVACWGANRAAQTPLAKLYRPPVASFARKYNALDVELLASDTISPKGKVIKRYRHADVKTPLACLRLLCDRGLARLKAGVTLAALQALADAQTDLAAVQEMQRAKAELFNRAGTRSAQQA